MKISLGFSPCPNDTFIFDALVNRKIDTGNFEFEVALEDVETLNNWSYSEKLDVTKLSFPAVFENREHYAILDSGAALGKGVGPLLVAKKMVDVPDVEHCRIAIPGLMTTANFLLSFAFPSVHQRIPMLFSKIEQALLQDEADLGVIIHENRFTYREKGLIKVADLGEIWEQKVKAPIPLGCIAAHRRLEPAIIRQLQELIRKSVDYALMNYPQVPEYVKLHAQEMQDDVMQKHIELYVNDYTHSLGDAGRKAIQKLEEVYYRSNKRINPSSQPTLYI